MEQVIASPPSQQTTHLNAHPSALPQTIPPSQPKSSWTSRRRIAIIIVAIAFILPLAVGAYYLGKNASANTQRLNMLTPAAQPTNIIEITSMPTLAIQTTTIPSVQTTATPIPTPTTYIQVTSAVKTPTKLPNQCSSDSDCPARQGCILHQCFSGECRAINMCTEE